MSCNAIMLSKGVVPETYQEHRWSMKLSSPVSFFVGLSYYCNDEKEDVFANPERNYKFLWFDIGELHFWDIPENHNSDDERCLP